MVSLNLRLLPKLLKRGILGGSSKNHYLAGNIRKIDMQLLFPKEHWKVTEHDEFFSVDLQDYTFVAGQLIGEMLTLKQKVEAQEANYKKASDRLKEAKSTLGKASPRYIPAATSELKQAERNKKAQKLELKVIKSDYKKDLKKKEALKKKETEQNG